MTLIEIWNKPTIKRIEAKWNKWFYARKLNIVIYEIADNHERDVYSITYAVHSIGASSTDTKRHTVEVSDTILDEAGELLFKWMINESHTQHTRAADSERASEGA